MSGTVEERYPEHAKQKEVWEESQGVGGFIEWLGDNGYQIAEQNDENGRLYPTMKSTEELLAGFYDLDLNVLEQEKRAMLTEMQSIYDEAGGNQ